MNVVNTILVTGATGFIGSALLKRIQSDGIYRPIAAVRSYVKAAKVISSDTLVVRVGDLCADTDWSTALDGVTVVVHAAGRAHVMKEARASSLAEFRDANVNGTLGLARQAANSGVSRFVFISSIGVNGNQSLRPFTVDDLPNPIEPYAISKYEAEEGLRQLSKETGMEIVIIRPPLVYGPGAPGNFGRLLRLVAKGALLPLGFVQNRRSLVALDNLVDLVIICIAHPAAANQTFLVSDGEDLSTTELLRRMAAALGKPARLLPVPVSLLNAGAALLGKRDVAQRLLGCLQVDISKTREMLGWTPPVGMDETLKKTAEDFLARSQN